MKIYAFTKPNNYDLLFKVLIKADDGLRHICTLWEQNGKHYVSTGKVISNDRKRYDFTESQEKEINDFINSNDTNREYFNINGLD